MRPACVAAFLLVSCVSVPVDFRPFTACSVLHRGGVELFRSGKVIGERTSEAGRHVWLFLADDEGDRRNVREVTEINRHCAQANDRCWPPDECDPKGEDR